MKKTESLLCLELAPEVQVLPAYKRSQYARRGCRAARGRRAPRHPDLFRGRHPRGGRAARDVPRIRRARRGRGAAVADGRGAGASGHRRAVHRDDLDAVRAGDGPRRPPRRSPEALEPRGDVRSRPRRIRRRQQPRARAARDVFMVGRERYGHHEDGDHEIGLDGEALACLAPLCIRALHWEPQLVWTAFIRQGSPWPPAASRYNFGRLASGQRHTRDANPSVQGTGVHGVMQDQ